MIKGWKKLTKAQRQHLVSNKMNDTTIFQQNINAQKKMRLESAYPDRPVCRDCDIIAQRLDMSLE